MAPALSPFFNEQLGTHLPIPAAAAWGKKEGRECKLPTEDTGAGGVGLEVTSLPDIIF